MGAVYNYEYTKVPMSLSTQGAKSVAIKFQSHPSIPFTTSQLGGHPIDQPRTGPNKNDPPVCIASEETYCSFEGHQRLRKAES
jgi:hypothetical protein